MRTLSAVLLVGLGMILGTQFVLAQDSFLASSSNSKFRGPNPFVDTMRGDDASSQSGAAGGLKIDTSRLTWEPGGSRDRQLKDDPQLEGFLRPVPHKPVTPAASALPNAPSTEYEPNIVHNSPSYAPETPRNLDWRFLTAHGVYAGAVIFDDLITMKGLGRPCGYVEGNNDLGPNPTAKSMAIHGLVEFAAVTTMDYLLKRTRVPGLSYIGAGIGTAKHLHGGIQWLNTGCF